LGVRVTYTVDNCIPGTGNGKEVINMNDEQKAKMLRILGRAALDLADILDGTSSSAPAVATGESAVVTSMPTWAKQRAAYLQAFVDAGHPLNLDEVKSAAKKAGYGNPGPATRQGYVKKAGKNNELRELTAKGKSWLDKWTGKAA
jgi:hypothetical protein